MVPEKWNKIKEVFHAAFEMPEPEREIFVSAACGDDSTMLFEVNALFASHAESDSLLEAPAYEAISNLVEDTTTPSRVGMIVGAYRIESEIGRGGMGAVYLASRADEAFDKKVAVKLIKRGFDTDEIIRRFRHERQILAALEHPNITRLLDGGSTDDGLPYLVMDYVDGKPLNVYSNENRLSIKKRLDIFLRVCSAVSYAHQNLVIHRDLKPSNILVTADGVPKLLDFGIAKLIAQNGDTPTIDKTLNTYQAMTPEYASPEQVGGQPVTTASDIYSLAVVLFELLTGHRPYRFKTKTADEINRILADTLPTKPSTVCRLQGLNVVVDNPQSVERTLKGDLDNIVLMAMRKESERRYSSVEQFAEDIRRYLAGLPVIAQEDTFSYRASKFVKRNKAGVAAGAGIAASLIGGLIAVSRQAKIASRQRDRARNEARKAEKVNLFLQKMLSSADPRQQGKDIKLVEILDLAADSIEKDFADEPAIIADLHTTIGLTFLAQGKFDLAEPHLTSALETRLKLFGRENHDTAISLSNFGQLLQARGDAARAERYYRRSLGLLRRLYGSRHLEISNVLHNLAYVSSLQGKNAEAINILREELAIRRALLNQNHPDIAHTLSELGSVLTVVGDANAAEPLQRQALAVMRRCYGDEHPDTASVLINLFGSIQHKNPVEAERLVIEALRIRRKLLGDDHPDVAWALYHLSFLKINKGEPVEAERLTREILNLRGSTLRDENLLVSNALLMLGRSLMGQDRLHEAEMILTECLELRRKHLPPEHWVLATTVGFLGECLMRLGQSEIGKNLIFESFSNLNEKLGKDHMHTQMALARIEKFLKPGGGKH